MESIYAALLLNKANKKITEANIEKILKAAPKKKKKEKEEEVEEEPTGIGSLF